MSEIFYSEVNLNLQDELNERAQAARRRNSKDIAFMTEKIANIELRAYEAAESGSKQIRGEQINKKLAILGGTTTRDGRYVPSGPQGFLNSQQLEYETNVVQIQDIGGGRIRAAEVPIQQTDNSRRIAPYIKVADISIGDGSMGLLNKANLSLSIPNPDRDLDEFESIWMRPGRYVQLVIRHPDSATLTEGLLSEIVLPDEDKLKNLYPEWTDLRELKEKILRMNEYTFSGLITSFDLSYDADASVSVTLQLTGTSDIYTDVTMFIDPKKKKENDLKTQYAEISTSGSSSDTLRNVKTQDTGSQAARVELYDKLSADFDAIRTKYAKSISSTIGSPFDSNTLSNFSEAGIVPYLNESGRTDRFIMFGQPYYNGIELEFVPQPLSGSDDKEQELLTKLADLNSELDFRADVRITTTESPEEIEIKKEIAEVEKQRDKLQQAEDNDLKRQEKQFEQEKKLYTELIDDNRYITLSSLIEFLNREILDKQQNKNGKGVLCDDIQIEGTHYEHLQSLDPESIFFLPTDPSDPSGINWYGTISYYPDAINNQQLFSAELQKVNLYKPWPGIVSKNSSGRSTLYPSRILINLESIKKIINDLSNFNARRFTFGAFMQQITSLIKSASGGAIEMTLTPHPLTPEVVLYADAESVRLEEIEPYKIPMFANDPRGTIVRDFQFSAKLPDSVKNLSYVLNQGTDISTEKIAPYMNFMFNADNTETVNKLIKDYEKKHIDAVTELKLSQQRYGLEPYDSDIRRELRGTTAEYLKYPTPDIRKSQQLTAPVFPIDASFTIDGINGFRYGDVLTFPGLPKKYTENTVFLIMGVNHTVSSEGAWTTKITCIMRPKIS